MFQTIFAIATSPRTYPLDIHLLSRLPVAVFWLALHLFQCTLANQYIPTGIAEDKLNKPERPIPSGRISAKNTKRIRWVVSLCCLVISTMYGRIVTSASAALTLFIYVYNEKGLSAHWAARNFMNGVAFAAFETGTTAVAGIGCGKQVCPGGSTDAPLDDIAIYAICVSASAFGTTIFAQDFKDIDGDALIGRRTVPMLMSDTNGRILLFVLMTSWSSYLVHFWQLGITTAVAYIGCSTLVCTRFLCWRGVKEDQISFYLYNVSQLGINVVNVVLIRPRFG